MRIRWFDSLAAPVALTFPLVGPALALALPGSSLLAAPTTTPATTYRTAAADLVGDAGPDARWQRNAAGGLELGTHLALTLPPGPAETVIDRLFLLYPRELPGPEGLTPHTRVLQLGPVEVVHRTWTWKNLLVEGLSVTAHVDARGRVVVLSALGLDRIGPRASGRAPSWDRVPQADAEARAYRYAARLPDLSPRQVSAARGLEASPEGLRAVWRVKVEPEQPGPAWELRLDATSGGLLKAVPLAVHAFGEQAPGSSPRGTVYADSPLDGGTLDVALENLTDPTHLTGEYVQVYNLAFQKNGPVTTSIYVQNATNQSGRFDYPPVEQYASGVPTQATQTDTFAEVMMYYHVDRVHQFFNELGYFNDDPSTGIDRPLKATVNYRSYSTGYYDNAYYSPPANSSDQGEIIFGQGEATDFTYDNSVTYHEYTHAVVDGTSNYLNTCIQDEYGTDCTQGGLNEGTADYFASTLRNDPRIGPYALAVWNPAYARDLTDGNRCPDDLYGEEHEDGKIWGGGLWDVRTALAGSNADLAHTLIDPIILAAISTPLPQDDANTSAFSNAAAILETDAQAAVTNGSLSSSQLQKLQQALTARGLSDCRRFVPLQPNDSRQGAFSTTGALKSIVAAGLQYVVEIPDNAGTFKVSLSGVNVATIHVRKDSPVLFNPSNGSVTSDYSVPALSLELSQNSAVELEPGHTYYIAFTTQQTLVSAFYGTYYTVTTKLTTQSGGGNTFESGDSGGCGCTQQGPDRGTGLGSMGVGALALWVFGRRRRES